MMSLLPSVDVRELIMTACMHIWTNIAGSAAVEESSMLTTGVGGGSLQHRGCGRRRDLIVEEVHGISISIPFVADISMERLHQYVNGLHHYGVEGTTACQGSSWIHRSSTTSSILTGRMRKNEEELGTPQPGSDEEGHGRAHTGLIKLIKASKELSFPIYYKSWSSYSCRSNNNNRFQVFVKPATA